MKHLILLSLVLDCVVYGGGLFRAEADAGNSAGMTNRETLGFALGEPHSPALRVDFSDTGEGLNRNEFPREGLNFEARCGLWTGLSSDAKTALALSGQNPFPGPGVSDLRQALVGKFVDEDVEYLGEILELIRVLVYGTKRSDVAFGLHAAHPFSFGTNFAGTLLNPSLVQVVVDERANGTWNEHGGAWLKGLQSARMERAL